MQPGLPERRPESSPCLIRILPPELWQVIFRRIDFVDFLSLVVAICCDPCEACVSHLQWISKAWKLLELDATERFLFALVAWAFPTIQLCVPSLCASRAADLGKLACTDPGSFWSSLRNHYGTIAMDLAVVSAQRLGVPNFLIEHALAEIAWELNFVQFGRMASKILDVDVRAQTYRRLVARYRIGPRSAAANVLAALEDNAPGRNQSFLALVVHDWDSWRKAEFYAVVNAALSDPQRLNRMFFMDQYVSRSIGT
ncbi:hypothetical protein CCYA_CCYA13G3632 [Cyanidiococcus yangmingshanensis]|nr:hypothetical protein CCYA_CCYA13G3632 [Cyanidiococcus yangmingshanensis]